jgi:hypothetical protein
MTTFFALAALLMAAASTASCRAPVRQRTVEIGTRMALARRQDVLAQSSAAVGMAAVGVVLNAVATSRSRAGRLPRLQGSDGGRLRRGGDRRARHDGGGLFRVACRSTVANGRDPRCLTRTFSFVRCPPLGRPRETGKPDAALLETVRAPPGRHLSS